MYDTLNEGLSDRETWSGQNGLRATSISHSPAHCFLSSPPLFHGSSCYPNPCEYLAATAVSTELRAPDCTTQVASLRRRCERVFWRCETQITSHRHCHMPSALTPPVVGVNLDLTSQTATPVQPRATQGRTAVPVPLLLRPPPRQVFQQNEHNRPAKSAWASAARHTTLKPRACKACTQSERVRADYSSRCTCTFTRSNKTTVDYKCGRIMSVSVQSTIRIELMHARVASCEPLHWTDILGTNITLEFRVGFVFAVGCTYNKRGLS